MSVAGDRGAMPDTTEAKQGPRRLMLRVRLPGNLIKPEIVVAPANREKQRLSVPRARAREPRKTYHWDACTMTTSAERMRRFRQRRRNGDVLVSLRINADGIADLIALGWLKAGASERETREALVRMMETAFAARMRSAPTNR